MFFFDCDLGISKVRNTLYEHLMPMTQSFECSLVRNVSRHSEPHSMPSQKLERPPLCL